MTQAEFLATLPRKVSSAAGVLRNAAGAVLIVKPTYKPGWELPGGVCELGESPRTTAQREVLEEIGLELRIGRLLCVDHVMPEGEKLEGLHFLFDGGMLDEVRISRMRLPAAELSEYRFVSLEEAQQVLVPRLRPRLAMALRALERGETVYLEGGQ